MMSVYEGLCEVSSLNLNANINHCWFNLQIRRLIPLRVVADKGGQVLLLGLFAQYQDDGSNWLAVIYFTSYTAIFTRSNTTGLLQGLDFVSYILFSLTHRLFRFKPDVVVLMLNVQG